MSHPTKKDKSKQAVRFELILKLARIYQKYLDNDLDDEARRFWGRQAEDGAWEHENKRPLSQIQLYGGRGGSELLTLKDCKDAWETLR